MTNEQIKEQIDKNNEKISNLLDFSKFVLNEEISNLIIENKKLQKKCSHSFEQGYCKFCYKEEEK